MTARKDWFLKTTFALWAMASHRTEQNKDETPTLPSGLRGGIEKKPPKRWLFCWLTFCIKDATISLGYHGSLHFSHGGFGMGMQWKAVKIGSGTLAEIKPVGTDHGANRVPSTKLTPLQTTRESWLTLTCRRTTLVVPCRVIVLIFGE